MTRVTPSEVAWSASQPPQCSVDSPYRRSTTSARTSNGSPARRVTTASVTAAPARRKGSRRSGRPAAPTSRAPSGVRPSRSATAIPASEPAVRGRVQLTVERVRAGDLRGSEVERGIGPARGAGQRMPGRRHHDHRGQQGEQHHRRDRRRPPVRPARSRGTSRPTIGRRLARTSARHGRRTLRRPPAARTSRRRLTRIRVRYVGVRHGRGSRSRRRGVGDVGGIGDSGGARHTTRAWSHVSSLRR